MDDLSPFLFPRDRFINCPTELVKIRQQSFPGAHAPSTWSLFKDIWAKGGLKGSFRGFNPCWMRDLGYGPYFLTCVCFSLFILPLLSSLPTHFPFTSLRAREPSFRLLILGSSGRRNTKVRIHPAQAVAYTSSRSASAGFAGGDRG